VPADSACPAPQPAESLLEVPCPRVLEIRKARAEPSPGDSASVVLPPGLLRLLMNPVAGGPEPLGRGIHPVGGFPIAVAACAAFAACGDPDPLSPRAWHVEYVRARWHRPVGQESSLLGKAELVKVQEECIDASLETYDQASGELVMSGTARLRRASIGGQQDGSQ